MNEEGAVVAAGAGAEQQRRQRGAPGQAERGREGRQGPRRRRQGQRGRRRGRRGRGGGCRGRRGSAPPGGARRAAAAPGALVLAAPAADGDVAERAPARPVALARLAEVPRLRQRVVVVVAELGVGRVAARAPQRLGARVRDRRARRAGTAPRSRRRLLHRRRTPRASHVYISARR
uniref:Uncharacterized protein n=1 Tax=Setaria italica TaxID=4555 RepID=K4A3K7_SETIT